jgi:hypothetical protein
MRNSIFSAGCLAAAMLPMVAHASDATDLQQLQQQIQQLQQQYQTQLQALREKLDAMQKKLDTASVAPPPEPKTAKANSFNPAIAVVLSGQAAHFSNDPDSYMLPGFVLGDEAGPGDQGLSLSESEITISSNVDNLFYGQMTASIAPDDSIAVEEAFIQTLGLPAGLTAKFGRIKSSIGYLNNQHSHVWDFADAPLAYRAMLGNQYADDGVQLTWLAPTDLYFEAGTEVFRGDSFPASGAAHDGVGAYTLFAHVGGDVGDSSSWRAGLSRLTTNTKDRDTDSLVFNGKDHVNIADFVWKWAPNGNPYSTNFKFQTEYLWGDEKGSYTGLGGIDVNRRGWYAQGVYQFMPRWRVGLRYDEVSSDNPGAAFAGTALDPSGSDPHRYSIMLDFSNSEFSRIRLQYNRDESGPNSDDQAFLQYQMSLGTHGAHQF